MSARTPRRSFARSFVVTLAAVPACGGGGGGAGSGPPMIGNPPAPEPTVPTSPPEPTPAPTPDPTPTPAPGEPAQAKPGKAPDYSQHWIVTKNGATCLAQPRVECPKGVPGQPMPTCNPPPASAYTCPDGMGAGPITVVRYANTFDCVIEPPPTRCPEGVRCNPPPPRRVECPK